MNNETEMTLILWEKIKEFIPQKSREDAAHQYMLTIVDYLEDVKIHALEGEDDNLDSAISAITGEEMEIIIEESEDDSWDEE